MQQQPHVVSVSILLLLLLHHIFLFFLLLQLLLLLFLTLLLHHVLHTFQRAANCPCRLLHREHVNQVRQSKQRLLEQIQQVHRFQEWDRDRDQDQDPEVHRYGSEWPTQLPFYSPELDPRNHKPSGLEKTQHPPHASRRSAGK